MRRVSRNDANFPVPQPDARLNFLFTQSTDYSGARKKLLHDKA